MSPFFAPQRNEHLWFKLNFKKQIKPLTFQNSNRQTTFNFTRRPPPHNCCQPLPVARVSLKIFVERERAANAQQIISCRGFSKLKFVRTGNNTGGSRRPAPLWQILSPLSAIKTEQPLQWLGAIRPTIPYLAFTILLQMELRGIFDHKRILQDNPEWSLNIY